MTTPAQQAYALLWRSTTDCPFTNRARRTLLATLTRDERIEAVKWLMANYAPLTTAEMIAVDIRAGVFPERSYDPEATP